MNNQVSSVIVDNPPPVERDPFVDAVWLLIYNMIEAGDTGTDADGRQKWWSEEFLTVKLMLAKRGFSLDPEKDVS